MLIELLAAAAALNPTGLTTRIDNPYWPMRPGARWVYRDGDERIVVRVTQRTRQIANGATARVVRDVVTKDGEFVEVTDDWYAQDEAGNVWYLGEDTTEYEDGKPVSKAGSWEAGVDGARAGIIMPARPRPGMRYRQEHAPGEAEDRGRVVSVLGDVVVTEDTTPLEPKVLEYKLYERGVGPVLVLDAAGGGGREELVSFHRPPARTVAATTRLHNAATPHVP